MTDVLVGYNTPLPVKKLYANPGDTLGLVIELEGLTPNESYYIEPVYSLLPGGVEFASLPTDFTGNHAPYSLHTDRLGRALFNSRVPLNFKAGSSTNVTWPELAFEVSEKLSATNSYRVSATLRSFEDFEDIVIDATDARMRVCDIDVGYFPRMDFNVGSREVTKERAFTSAVSVSLTVDDTSNGLRPSPPINQTYTTRVRIMREYKGIPTVSNVSGMVTLITSTDSKAQDYLNAFVSENLLAGSRYPVDLVYNYDDIPGTQMSSRSLRTARITVLDVAWNAQDSMMTGFVPNADYRMYFTQLLTDQGDYLDTGWNAARVLTANSDGSIYVGDDNEIAGWRIASNSSLPMGTPFQILANIERIDNNAPLSGYPTKYGNVGQMRSSVITNTPS